MKQAGWQHIQTSILVKVLVTREPREAGSLYPEIALMLV